VGEERSVADAINNLAGVEKRFDLEKVPALQDGVVVSDWQTIEGAALSGHTREAAESMLKSPDRSSLYQTFQRQQDAIKNACKSDPKECGNLKIPGVYFSYDDKGMVSSIAFVSEPDEKPLAMVVLSNNPSTDTNRSADRRGKNDEQVIDNQRKWDAWDYSHDPRAERPELANSPSAWFSDVVREGWHVAQDNACTNRSGRTIASVNDVLGSVVGGISDSGHDLRNLDGKGVAKDLIESGEMFGHGFYTIFDGTVCPERQDDPSYFSGGGYLVDMHKIFD
jgi:hypothetical protein